MRYFAETRAGDSLWQVADQVIERALAAAAPDQLVKEAIQDLDPARPYYLVAIGKAAWTMAKAAADSLGPALKQGIVITKDGHSRGEIEACEIYEAGHPVLDQRSLNATAKALDLVAGLDREDRVLFLVSGGGSALFEQSQLDLAELSDIGLQLLQSGADIVAINTIRKRLSEVKGGRFGRACYPAEVEAIVLSDVLGDRPDMIASGPAALDLSTVAEAEAIIDRYKLKLSPEARALIGRDLPTDLGHVRTRIVGSVSMLCRTARELLTDMGYECLCLSDSLDCEARELGRMLGAMARSLASGRLAGGEAQPAKKIAVVCGGETIVTIGPGSRSGVLGGRNQEIALAAAPYLEGLARAMVFSLGSDGTDGPTDAAGGIVDQDSAQALRAAGLVPSQLLADHDSYHGLKKVGNLIMTGPTGTNLNDLTVLLLEL